MKATGAVLSLLLAGCEGEGSALACEDYGVLTTGNTGAMAPVSRVVEASPYHVSRACAELRGSSRDACVLRGEDGFEVYVPFDNEWLKIHEFCHLKHGVRHTPDYLAGRF